MGEGVIGSSRLVFSGNHIHRHVLVGFSINSGNQEKKQ